MKRTTIIAIATATMLAILTASAFANEGTGTADFCQRHGCGDPVDPGSVTECPDVVCPDSACPSFTCPDVTCEATDCTKTTVVVNPTPCPAVVFPRYYPCRQKKDGTFVCPRKATPHRAFLPATDPASGK